MPRNWFIVQEARWRDIACGVWTFLLSFAVVVAFLLVWIFTPLQHVINICNYYIILFSFRSWFVITCISILSALYLKILVQNFSVICVLECSRICLLTNYLNCRNWFYSLCSGILCLLIAALTAKFSVSTFSIFTQCNSSLGTFRCLNEAYIVFLFFAFLLGFTHHMSAKASQFYTLKFPIEQLGRFLSMKVSFTGHVVESAKQAVDHLKYFLVLYYIFGVFPRYMITAASDYPFCDADLIGFNNYTGLISVVWTLWIFGTFLLLLIHLSWHLFNSYHTKFFAFPVDSVFPEDEPRLLTVNLSKNQPMLVQHLAFQYLSMISKYSVAKRKQLFIMKFVKQGKRLLKWDIVADECLSRITGLTENLKAYHQSISASKKDTSSENKPTEKSSEASLAGPSSRLQSGSILKRRPLADTTNNSQLNASYFEVSAANASTRQADTSAFLNNSLVVPTPKLWTQNENKLVASPGTEIPTSSSKKGVPHSKSSKRSLYTKLKETLRQLPFIAYFVNKIPDREAAKLFSEHNILRWAIESVSLLVAASLTEDEYGFVQRRIDQVLVALFDLLTVLEKNTKLPIIPTNPWSTYFLRQQYGLKAETKAAIYRISNTFAKYVDTIPLKSDYTRRLKAFIDQKE